MDQELQLPETQHQVYSLDFAFQELFEMFMAEVGICLLWITASFLVAVFRLAKREKTALSFFHPAYWFSTCFGLGKIPFISGTWGSVFAINLMMMVMIFPRMGWIYENTIFWILAFATLISNIVGIKSSDIYSQRMLASTITGKTIRDDIMHTLMGMALVMGGLYVAALFNKDSFTWLNYFSGNLYFWGLLFITFGFCAKRITKADKYAKKMDKADPSAVIIDEVGGQLIAISLITIFLGGLYRYDYDTFRPLLYLMPFYAVVIFVFFRYFDITKPWIIGKLDRNLKGGLGIMADDMVAGVFAAILFIALFLILHFSGGFFWFYSNFLPEWIGMPAIKGQIQ